MINIEPWAAIVGLFAMFIGFLWNTASIYGDLKYQIRQNREDINRMGNNLRKEIKNENWWMKALIHDIQEFLNRTNNYYPPSFRREDDQ